ncbi:MAG: hypothetical protein KVP17_001808 [Porospora cf. gigantea B]|uniref:uncharacterized protein n=1 Tax=Porospora cf. gigantea B TaxID=2853592 RepID=UPI003571D5B7|nr:MAG: hypothetical protein KVP17_001808 [Porospora cf. gigantea B]
MAEYLGTCALEHSSWGFRTYDSGAFGTGGGLHGENLAWSSGGEACSFPTHKWIEAWSTERANYNCLTNQAQDDKPIGHWTQIAWQATTHVGCAVDCGCKASHGTWFDTSFGCQYGPSGNYQGYRPFPVDDCPPEMIHGTTTTLEPRTMWDHSLSLHRLEPGCYQAQKFDMLGRPELFSDWPTWENWCDQIIVGKTCEEALAYAVANGNTDCGIVILGG